MSASMVDQVLSRLGFDALTQMQEESLKTVQSGQDLVLLAPTGSGKTLAYLLPHFLASQKGSAPALVIVPTRELAQQVASVWKMAGGKQPALCFGGRRREQELNALRNSPELIIGTPGRLADHIRHGNINTEAIRFLVLDEFDKSLELGFQQEMAEVIAALPQLRQRVLCSATNADDIPTFTGLRSAITLHFGATETSENRLLRYVIPSPDKDKAATLFKLLCELGNRHSVVFLNHREAVDRLTGLLQKQGISATAYHGALEQEARETALAQFRNGSVRTLIATDLAARGLDVSGLECIVHYHLPLDEPSYTHRSGRTGRMGASGEIFLLLGPEEKWPPFLKESDFLPFHWEGETTPPALPEWVSLRIAAGRKDKLSKTDILGFLTKVAGLQRADTGLIELHDHYTLFAVKKSAAKVALQALKSEKLKGRKRLAAPAR